MIVDAQSGFAIDPGARPETVAGLARAMVDLATEIETGRSRKDACIQRAFQQFHWKMLADAIIGKYVEIADPER